MKKLLIAGSILATSLFFSACTGKKIGTIGWDENNLFDRERVASLASVEKDAFYKKQNEYVAQKIQPKCTYGSCEAANIEPFKIEAYSHNDTYNGKLRDDLLKYLERLAYEGNYYSAVSLAEHYLIRLYENDSKNRLNQALKFYKVACAKKVEFCNNVKVVEDEIKKGIDYDSIENLGGFKSWKDIKQLPVPSKIYGREDIEIELYFQYDFLKTMKNMKEQHKYMKSLEEEYFSKTAPEQEKRIEEWKNNYKNETGKDLKGY